MRAHQGRYHRQEILPQVGVRGQARLASARAVVVGCGALGCASADLLARAGVGHLRLIDRDVVDLTNLQRQGLFDEGDAVARAPKAAAAARRLARVNSGIVIEGVVADVRPDNVVRLAGELGGEPAHVILDGTDNFETRYLLNDVAVKYGIPFVYGGAVGARGVVMPVLAGSGACLRCIRPAPPEAGTQETCDTAGVLGAATTVVGALQASLAIRILVEGAGRVRPALVEVDAWGLGLRRVEAGGRSMGCPCCGGGRFEFLDAEDESESAVLCGQDAVQIMPAGTGGLDLDGLCRRLARHGSFRADGVSCRGRLAGEASEAEGEGIELTVFGDGRAIVRGTRDPARARSIYTRYVGA